MNIKTLLIAFEYLLCSLIFICSATNGQAQTTVPKEIYNKEFNWTITIPENFQNVSAEAWAKMQNKGADAIEKTYDEKVINRAKVIFVFKSDQFNYFESNYQPFDIAVDGNYLASCKNVNDILYQTFKAQILGAKIDTVRAVEKNDHLNFQTFKMKIEYPNKVIMNLIMFSRLFGKKEFTVNIMYVDHEKGKQMIEAWKKSTFTKSK